MGDFNLQMACFSWGALGDRKPRLSQIEGTYGKTTNQDSRYRGLLAGDSKLEMTACVSRVSSKSKWCSWNRPLLYRGGYQTTTNVAPGCGHGIASVMVSPRGLLKAEFRNGVLVVYHIKNPEDSVSCFTRSDLVEELVK